VPRAKLKPFHKETGCLYGIKELPPSWQAKFQERRKITKTKWSGTHKIFREGPSKQGLKRIQLRDEKAASKRDKIEKVLERHRASKSLKMADLGGAAVEKTVLSKVDQALAESDSNQVLLAELWRKFSLAECRFIRAGWKKIPMFLLEHDYEVDKNEKGAPVCTRKNAN